MALNERDILHENGQWWVLRMRGLLYVMRAGITHSTSESTAYPDTPDGLSIAKARCDYMARMNARNQTA